MVGGEGDNNLEKKKKSSGVRFASEVEVKEFEKDSHIDQT